MDEDDLARMVWRSLRDALHNLALPRPAQVALIPSLGHVDELALDFRNFLGASWQARQRGWISTPLDACMKRIDELLDGISAGGINAEPDQWTEEALATSDVWAAVRDLAHRCLALMPIEPWSSA